MRKLIAITQLSLDGVMQAPGGPDEDRDSGFTHGGWFMGFDDDAVPKAMDKLISGEFALLLGRRTYDIFASYWPQHVDNPIGKAFGKAVKYVVTGKDKGLDWETSVRVGGKAAEGVRKLKATKGPPLHVWGSSELLQALIAADLVDEYQFWTAPVVLGYGKRLFEAGVPPQKLQLVEGKIGSGGVLVTTYRPVGPLPQDSKAKGAPRKKPAAKNAKAGKKRKKKVGT
ncbi:MAG: bifunctional deaminase-reductase domain protein [Fibrobacteres bacterium]|nr:bifunctional deaminase-reductase domain protein [Fibrobacterota bacterium]